MNQRIDPQVEATRKQREDEAKRIGMKIRAGERVSLVELGRYARTPEGYQYFRGSSERIVQLARYGRTPEGAAYLSREQHGIVPLARFGRTREGSEFLSGLTEKGAKIRSIESTPKGLQITYSVPEWRDVGTWKVSAETAREKPLSEAEWMAQQRREEYRVAPLVAPILEDVKVHGDMRLSDIIYSHAAKQEGYPKFWFEGRSPAKAWQFLGGIVESGESTLETVFPYPVPVPERPVSAARIGGLVAGSVLQMETAKWVFKEQLQVAKQTVTDKWRTSRLDQFLREHSERYARHATRQIARGYVDVPDTGIAGPRTMTEKVLGLPELESPYRLGLKGMEAEQTALAMGTAPKTTLLDPLVSSVLEQPVTRDLFIRASVDLGRKAAETGFASSVGLAMAQTLVSIPKPSVKTKPSPSFETPFIPKIPEFKQEQKNIPSLAPFIGLKPFTLFSHGIKTDIDTETETMLEQFTGQTPEVTTDQFQRMIAVQETKTVQIQRTSQIFRTQQISMPRFDTKTPKFPVLPKRKRRKRLGTDWYLWEFPILDIGF